MTDWIVPCVIAGILLYGLWKGVDLYDALTCGMKAGLRVCAGIFPAVLTMLVAITMVRASGAIDLLSAFLGPVLEAVGMPAECLPLALLRPFSGSGALSVGSAVMAQCGPDSRAGRVAAVMLGSSDTSFYTIAVYSAYLGLKNTRYTLKAALTADAVAFLMSGLAVGLLMR
ncbi:MAG: spore maturation protein [Clostridiaceae bacterium]|nr:spore maturation protein [Clostridia bacterium]MDY3870484.1 spore maturation protein [Clostridiaceae bacterium]